MARHLRYQSKPWATHHVVSRCTQGFSFLTPHPHVVMTCAGILAYALKQHEGRVTLQHHAFLSNHFHLMVSCRQRADLSSFMMLFKSKLTRELNRLHQWRGPLWEGRYASEELLDEASVIKVLKYITKNSIKEGLVDHPSQWSGLHGYHQLVERQPLCGPYVDRTSLHHERLEQEEDAITIYEARLLPPPIWEAEGIEAYHQRCAELFEEAIAEALEERDGSSMGMERVLRQPTLQGREAPPGARPLCRAQCRELLQAFKERYKSFKLAFQEVSRALRRAIALGLPMPSLTFPEGGVPLFGGRPLEVCGERPS
jgi:putative transposase